jgi:hypothetical protein
MLRSIAFIKFLHTLIFFIMSIANIQLLFSAIIGSISILTIVAFTIIFVEGVVLLFNGWRCPLRIYAERIGAVSGQITDIFLPKWFADRIFLFCGGLFAFSVSFFIIRIICSVLGIMDPILFI